MANISVRIAMRIIKTNVSENPLNLKRTTTSHDLPLPPQFMNDNSLPWMIAIIIIITFFVILFSKIIFSDLKREMMERCMQFFSAEFNGYDHSEFVCSHIIYSPMIK